ncbi:MAG TPA: T9SS type A sorting domain-containing protein [Bacteroidia bacterium]|nr:T9SS type A sorting domain-containing protein [Bacteroidia bacterium]
MSTGSKCVLIFLFSFCVAQKLSAQSDTIHKPIVLIYPDANRTVFYVSTGMEFADMDISVNVYDLTGRLVQENMIKGGAAYGFFIGNLNNGIYFIQAKHNEEIIGNQKISVQVD